MPALRAAFMRVAGLFGRSRRDRDLDAEIESHLHLHIDDNLRAGMSPAEARRHALLKLGGADQTKEAYRDRRGFPLVDSPLQDLKHAVRSLRRSPVVTATALLTLALGIGANTAMFSVMDAVMLKPLPYPHADRIVGLWERRPDGRPNSMTVLNYLDYATQNTVFEKIAATTNCCGVKTVTDSDAPFFIAAARVSPAYFDILGIRPFLGRTFLAGEDTAGRDHIVILSHNLWAAHFGSDPRVVGTRIHVDGELYAVVGIMPAGAPFDRMLPNAWVPLTFTPENTSRNSHWLISVTGAALAQLKPGVTIEQARADLDTVARRIAAEHPETNKDWGVSVEPYAEEIVGGPLRESLILLLTAVGAVLLVACINLANLMLARGLARQREFAVKLALGASAGRLIRQALTEGALVAVTGGTLGVVVGASVTTILFHAIDALPVSPDLTSRPVPAEAITGVDFRVLMFSAALALVCVAIFAVVPAVRTIGGSRMEMLASGYRIGGNRAHTRTRQALIVVEVALACVLLTCAGLLIHSFFNMQRADTGFDGTDVVTAAMPIRNHRFARADDFLAFIHQVQARLEALPGVQEVAFTNSQPTTGTGVGTFVQVVGHPFQVRAQRPGAGLEIVSPSYFRALRIHVQSGRALDDHDQSGAPMVAVINETMARLFFGAEDPLHRVVLINDSPFGNITVVSDASCEIVGVVADERVSPFQDKTPHPLIYVSVEQKPSDFATNLVIRTGSDPAGMEHAVGAAVAEVDGEQALTNFKTVRELQARLTAPDQFRAILLTSFASLALLLAGIGVYGVTSYSVGQRQHEMGIRAALGASPRDLVRFVVGGGMRAVTAGLALGCVAGFVAARLLRAFLFGVGTTDVVTLAVTVSVLASVAAVASFLPARRAGRVSPIEALRAE